MPQDRADNGQFIAQNELEASMSREELLKMTSTLLKKMHARCTAQRFRAKNDDNTWLAMVRAYSQCASVQAAMLKDDYLDEILRRLDEVESRQAAKK
jgi:hypothetical protein